MRRISPYAYAFNNPIRFTDPDGMVPTDPVKEKTITSNGNTDVISETSTTSTSSTRIVKEGTEEYISLLGKSNITSSNGIGNQISVTESTTTTTETSVSLEYDGQGNVTSRNESGSTTTETSLNVTVSDQFGGDAGGFSKQSSNTTNSNSPVLSSELGGLANDAIGYRSSNGNSITNRDEFAGAIARQQKVVNGYDKYSPAGSVGIGVVGGLAYGSGPGFLISMATFSVGLSLKKGLQNLKKKSNSCNNCTKKY